MYITASQAAEKAGVTRRAIYKAMELGNLKKVTIALRTFVDTSDLTDYMASPRFRARGRKPGQAATNRGAGRRSK